MDMRVIDKTIQDLENTDETTIEDVKLLSCLYIVKTHFQNTGNLHDGYSNSIGSETFPYYNKYKEVKRKYQLNQTTEGEVIRSMKNTCRELKDFVELLYYNTDMNKERLCIKAVLGELYKNFCD